MADVKPCPFCGATNVAVEKLDGRPPYAEVWCGHCESKGPPIEDGPLHSSPDEAVRLWNHRPEEARLRSALQAAERERDEAIALFERNLALGEQLLQDRDSARAEAGRLAQELADARDATIARLREALEFYGAAENWQRFGDRFVARGDLSHDADGVLVPGKRAREALGK